MSFTKTKGATNAYLQVIRETIESAILKKSPRKIFDLLENDQNQESLKKLSILRILRIENSDLYSTML